MTEKVKKMSPETFRRWAELSLKYYNQRKEREAVDSLVDKGEK